MLGGKARARVIATLVGALVFSASPFPKASALTSDEGSLLSYTNSARASHGLAKLSLASDLVAVARKHSAEMAAKGTIYHNSSLPSEVSGWRKIGENVGRGPSAKAIHQAFMSSSSHRAHILDGAYDQIGVGAVWGGSGSNKLLYVTEVFVDRAGSSKPKVSAPKYTPKKYVPATKPKKRPKPAPPAKPLPLTLDLLLQLSAMDAPTFRPAPAPDAPELP